jgi:uncharacterized protein
MLRIKGLLTSPKSLLKTRSALAFVFLLLTGNIATAQFTIPEKPSTNTKQVAVYDYISELSVSEKQALESKLVQYADTTSTQIVVAIIATTQGEDISLLGAQWGQKWGV